MIDESYESKFSFDYYTNNEGSQSNIGNFTKPIFKIFVVNESTDIDKICSICGSSFNNKFKMERHVRDIHEKNDKIEIDRDRYEISNMIQISEELSKKNIELKKIYTPEILCKKGLKEVVSIFNSANNLDFAESPDYEKYINLLNPIKKN